MHIVFQAYLIITRWVFLFILDLKHLYCPNFLSGIYLVRFMGSMCQMWSTTTECFLKEPIKFHNSLRQEKCLRPTALRRNTCKDWYLKSEVLWTSSIWLESVKWTQVLKMKDIFSFLSDRCTLPFKLYLKTNWTGFRGATLVSPSILHGGWVRWTAIRVSRKASRKAYSQPELIESLQCKEHWTRDHRDKRNQEHGWGPRDIDDRWFSIPVRHMFL